ncbi:hypothetical protein [Streptomyces sp. NPDC048338]|uniref:hypothetical protein n=1 Tax=Streptomyces sp. NPDC048338 TaxID=3365536 RepID=UPI00372210F7
METDLHPDDANRLRVALPRCLRRLETHAQRRQKVVQQLREKPTEALYYVAVGLLEDDRDVSQEEKDVVAALTVRMEEARAAKEAARRAAIERAREERRRVEQEQRDAWFEELAASREAMEQQTAAKRVVIAERVAQAREQRPQQDRQARADKVAQLAPAVRGALKKAAREHRVTTWPELRDKTGLRELGRLDHSDKVELLALVEAGTTPEAPCCPPSSSPTTTATPSTSTATSHGSWAAPCPPATPTSSTNSPTTASSFTTSTEERPPRAGTVAANAAAW